MANRGVLQKIMGYSPHIEMIVRRIYRNKYLNPLFIKEKIRKNTIAEKSFDFEEVTNYLKSIGIKKGDILIVHSAYKPLKPTGLTPDEIIDSLLQLVGTEGTLVMPVIRFYPESPTEVEALTADVSDIVFDYDVQNSKVWTGVIAKLLMQRSESVTSRLPLNTITAIGPDAEKMIRNELLDEFPTPNGNNSAWKYCTDKNAWVVSLGTDLTHSLTMIHTIEDSQIEKWPIKNWYRKVTFKIKDKDFQIVKTILERRPKWGMLHFGERKLSQDLINDGILTTKEINGVVIESLRSKTLFNYLNNKNSKGYPYFWVQKHLKN